MNYHYHYHGVYGMRYDALYRTGSSSGTLEHMKHYCCEQTNAQTTKK